MVIVKRIAKGITIFIGVVLLAGVVFIASDWRFYKRLATFDRMNSMTDMAWYEPVVEVTPGTPPEIPVATADTRTLSDDLVSALEAYAEGNGSMSLLVWHQGALQMEWYGEGFDKDSYMESASMHKSVMALLYGIAIEQGHIPSVDEPASTYLTEWQDDARSKITIRNMLQMAHGLSRASGGFSPLGDNMKLGMGTNWGGIALKSMAEDPPGAVFAYSNLNSQLLGLILQRATGVQYAEFLQKNLWSKVGESSARVWLDRPGGLAKTSGSLFTPPRNWLRLGLLHLNKGRVGDEQVVPEAWIDQVITPSPNNPNYGLQTWLGTEYRPKVDYGKGVAAHVPHSEPFEASDVVYFDGANGQRVYVIASEALVIVRMGKGGLDFKTGAFLWDEPKLPNLVLRGLRSAATEAEQP
ncbi:MAG: serine hydrolase [Alphaproteobacteria bacterium]|nr:serine hydrolase [Alphaproteobacteria bacterium]